MGVYLIFPVAIVIMNVGIKRCSIIKALYASGPLRINAGIPLTNSHGDSIVKMFAI